MKIEDKIKEKIVIWFLGTLLTGFISGIAVYETIIRISKLDVVRLGNYIKKEEFNNLKQKYDLLLNENRRLNKLKIKKQSTSSISKDKYKNLRRLEELINEGNQFYEGNDKDFDFDIWKRECVYLIDIFDKIYDWNYKTEFVKVTDHPKSKVFLNYPSVGKSLIILNTIYDVLK